MPQAQPAPPVVPDVIELAAMINGGRHAELEAKARAVLRREPASGLMWKALGVSLRLQGKDAVPALARAAELLPEDAEAHCNLGNALSDLGKRIDAVASYRRALATKPDFAEAHSNMGNALQGLGQFDEAVACYGQALAIKPSYAEAHSNLGNALRSLGRLDEAVASYGQALGINPSYAEAHSNLGNALRSLGRLDEAVASYGQALEINPSYAEAYNNLGNALLDLRQFDAAAGSYRRALEVKPHFAEAYSNLGNALRGLGDLDGAVASYGRALALTPQFAAAHSNLSDALRDLGRIDEAAACSRRALQLEPGLAGAHNGLGNALLDLGKLDEAAVSFRRALAFDPRLAEAHINLGLALRQQGRISEAEASCRAALALKPRASPALVLLGELRADQGQFAQAEELFRRAAAIDPESPEAWAGIAHLRKMTASDAQWAAQAQRIADKRLSPRQEVYLRFALGKYFDDLQCFEPAFANYQRANDLTKRYGIKHDRGRMTRAVDGAIQTYDNRWAHHARINAMEAPRPVFIVGMPRSGTTLAEQILASHPAVFGAGELTFWADASATHPLSPGGEADGAIPSKLAIEYLRLLDNLSADALRVVDKMPANFLCLGLIHEALPNARIIHMQRNPLDTCLSIYFQHFKTAHSYANDLEDLLHYYSDYARLMGHWRRILPDHVMLDVPYEELVDDQEVWSRKMLDFIDLPWDARCLDFHRTHRSVATASKWQVRQKMSRSSVDRWRNYAKFLGPLLALTDASGC